MRVIQGDDSRHKNVTLRLFLVRHGETLANAQHVVAGQSESVRLYEQKIATFVRFNRVKGNSFETPLTENGILQTKALARSRFLNESFWRVYSSDLERTRHTTQLLLRNRKLCQSTGIISTNGDDTDSAGSKDEFDPDERLGAIGVVLDPRLRELAKGAREGMPVSWTYDRAVQEYQARTPTLSDGTTIEMQPMPLLESKNDAWNRVVEWLQELVGDVLSTAVAVTGDSRDENGSLDSATRPIDHRYSVLVVAHATLLRVFLVRLLGLEVFRSHPNATFDPNDERHLVVPNTSLTILDLHVNPVRVGMMSGNSHHVSLPFVAGTDIVLLTSTEHYDDIDIPRQGTAS